MLAVKVMARQGRIRMTGVNEDVYSILETIGFISLCEVERAQ